MRSGALEHDDTNDLTLLDPEGFRVVAGPANTLSLEVGGESWPRAIAVWAFPFTDRRHWIAFRDVDDKPIGMLRDINDLDKDSRGALLQTLERRYFLPRVSRVLAAREEFGLLTVDADTDRGRVAFTVNNPRENIHWIGTGRILFVDAEENRYEIPDFDALDHRSQTLLSNVI